MEKQKILTKKERKEIKRQAKKDKKVHQVHVKNTKKYITKSFIALIVVLTVVGFWKLSQQPADSPLASSDLLQIQNDDWTKGNIDSSIVLVEYLDFECEACGAYYPLVKRLSEEYGNKMVFVSRYFPLSGHKNGMTAALAVEAAGKQGKYWEMHDLLFEKQRIWGEKKISDPTIFEGYAKQLNLDMEQFKKDVDSKEVRNRVIGDRRVGDKLGVNSTPTFFLNGEKIQNPRGYEAFKSLLNEALLK